MEDDGSAYVWERMGRKESLGTDSRRNSETFSSSSFEDGGGDSSSSPGSSSLLSPRTLSGTSSDDSSPDSTPENSFVGSVTEAPILATPRLLASERKGEETRVRRDTILALPPSFSIFSSDLVTSPEHPFDFSSPLSPPSSPSPSSPSSSSSSSSSGVKEEPKQEPIMRRERAPTLLSDGTLVADSLFDAIMPTSQLFRARRDSVAVFKSHSDSSPSPSPSPSPGRAPRPSSPLPAPPSSPLGRGTRPPIQPLPGAPRAPVTKAPPLSAASRSKTFSSKTQFGSEADKNDPHSFLHDRQMALRTRSPTVVSREVPMTETDVRNRLRDRLLLILKDPWQILQFKTFLQQENSDALLRFYCDLISCSSRTSCLLTEHSFQLFLQSLQNILSQLESEQNFPKGLTDKLVAIVPKQSASKVSVRKRVAPPKHFQPRRTSSQLSQLSLISVSSSNLHATPPPPPPRRKKATDETGESKQSDPDKQKEKDDDSVPEMLVASAPETQSVLTLASGDNSSMDLTPPEPKESRESSSESKDPSPSSPSSSSSSSETKESSPPSPPSKEAEAQKEAPVSEEITEASQALLKQLVPIIDETIEATIHMLLIDPFPRYLLSCNSIRANITQNSTFVPHAENVSQSAPLSPPAATSLSPPSPVMQPTPGPSLVAPSQLPPPTGSSGISSPINVQHSHRSRDVERKIDESEDILFGPGHLAGEMIIDAATLKKLIDFLLQPNVPDSQFVFAFVLTYRYFLKTGYELFAHLFDTFSVILLQTIGEKSSILPIVVRITNVIKLFADLHPKVIHSEPLLLERLREFLSTEVAKHMTAASKSISLHIDKRMDSCSLPCRPEFHPSDEDKPPKIKVTKAVRMMEWKKLRIDSLTPKELARQITILDQNLFRAIWPGELLGQSWTKQDKQIRSPHVLANISQFCSLSMWIASEIVSQTDIERRANVLGRSISIAYECFKLQNFNSAMSIATGLQNCAVRRLRQTWNLLSPSCWDQWEELETIFSCDANFAALRLTMNSITLPAIPYLGMFLSDLTFIDSESNVLEEKPEMINFVKMRYISTIIKQIQNYQETPYILRPLLNVQLFLKRLHFLSEKELYNQSLVCEGRTDLKP